MHLNGGVQMEVRIDPNPDGDLGKEKGFTPPYQLHDIVTPKPFISCHTASSTICRSFLGSVLVVWPTLSSILSLESRLSLEECPFSHANIGSEVPSHFLDCGDC